MTNTDTATPSATVIDMTIPANARGVQLITLVHALRLEVNHGFTPRGVRSLDAAERILGVRFTRKAKALEAAEAAKAEHEAMHAPRFLVDIEVTDEHGGVIMEESQRGSASKADLIALMGAENTDALIRDRVIFFENMSVALIFE